MTIADRIVVLIALIALPFLYLHFWSSNQGDLAKIIVTGGDEMLVPLNENKVITVQGPLGESQLEVKDGRIRFVDSPCQGKQCISSGWLQASGAFTACLPNRISLTISGTTDAFDSINF